MKSDPDSTASAKVSPPMVSLIDFTETSEGDAEAFFDYLLREAVRTTASDLFLTCREERIDISFREMGSVRSWGSLGPEEGIRLMTHIKAIAEMDLTRLPHPQDGRVGLSLNDGKRIDLRLSTLPTLHGEDMAIRILDRSRMLLGMEDIGFHPVNFRRLLALISRPGGLVLITGPTGTGKTTTLYASLNFLNDGTRKIHTLEDPIEFALDGIHQSQINLRRGVDFPDLLRGVLRQSPDVIMVGEIRDVATAEIAVRAANSGHLVFATSHSGTTAGAYEAMLVLGVQPQFLASSLLGIVTQRLVRKLCPDCKMPLVPDHLTDETTAASPGESPKQSRAAETIRGICVPKGCPNCNHTGFVGRIAIGEVLRATSEIKRLIRLGASSHDIHRTAVRQGMIDLVADARQKLEDGLTCPDEILRSIPGGFDEIQEDSENETDTEP